MDEMRINLSSKLMRGLLTKVITSTIKKTFGLSVDVNLTKLEIVMTNGKIFIDTNISASTDSEPVINLIKDKFD